VEIDEAIIIDSRSGGSVSGRWTEGLCLKKTAPTVFRLFVGRHGYIGDTHDFYDEEIVEEIVPDDIDGEIVQSTFEGMIFGGEILENEDSGAVDFYDVDETGVTEWLREIGWFLPGTLRKISKHII
jgi:hypothetical protein